MTDVSGKRSYLGCLCYFEQISQKRDSHVLNIELNENANLEDVKEAITASEYSIEEFYYVPRCLCVVSRNRYYQTLKVSIFIKAFHEMSTNLAHIKHLLESRHQQQTPLTCKTMKDKEKNKYLIKTKQHRQSIKI